MQPSPGKIQSLPVKVLYTIDTASQSFLTVLREPQDVYVHPSSLASSTELMGSCALKPIARGLCFSSPECTPSPTLDFSVYCIDPSARQSDGHTGKGFLSWSLLERGVGSTLVRGRLVRAYEFSPAHMSGGGLEALVAANSSGGAGTSRDADGRGWGLEVVVALRQVNPEGKAEFSTPAQFEEMLQAGKSTASAPLAVSTGLYPNGIGSSISGGAGSSSAIGSSSSVSRSSPAPAVPTPPTNPSGLPAQRIDRQSASSPALPTIPIPIPQLSKPRPPYVPPKPPLPPPPNRVQRSSTTTSIPSIASGSMHASSPLASSSSTPTVQSSALPRTGQAGSAPPPRPMSRQSSTTSAQRAQTSEPSSLPPSSGATASPHPSAPAPPLPPPTSTATKSKPKPPPKQNRKSTTEPPPPPPPQPQPPAPTTSTSAPTPPPPVASSSRPKTPPRPHASSSQRQMKTPPPPSPSRAALLNMLNVDAKMSPELAQKLAGNPFLVRLLKAVPPSVLAAQAGAHPGGTVGSQLAAGADREEPGSPTPERPSAQKSKGPVMITQPEGCCNCGATESEQWMTKKFKDGTPRKVCNACGLYFNKHKRMRPRELWSKETRGHASPLSSSQIHPPPPPALQPTGTGASAVRSSPRLHRQSSNESPSRSLAADVFESPRKRQKINHGPGTGGSAATNGDHGPSGANGSGSKHVPLPSPRRATRASAAAMATDPESTASSHLQGQGTNPFPFSPNSMFGTSPAVQDTPAGGAGMTEFDFDALFAQFAHATGDAGGAGGAGAGDGLGGVLGGALGGALGAMGGLGGLGVGPVGGDGSGVVPQIGEVNGGIPGVDGLADLGLDALLSLDNEGALMELLAAFEREQQGQGGAVAGAGGGGGAGEAAGTEETGQNQDTAKGEP